MVEQIGSFIVGLYQNKLAFCVTNPQKHSQSLAFAILAEFVITRPLVLCSIYLYVQWLIFAKTKTKRIVIKENKNKKIRNKRKQKIIIKMIQLNTKSVPPDEQNTVNSVIVRKKTVYRSDLKIAN